MATKNGWYTVNEPLRRIIGASGHEVKLTNVTAFNITGSWQRFKSDQGIVFVNPANVLAYTISNPEPSKAPDVK